MSDQNIPQVTEFKLPKGIEILFRQILKMLNLDPNLIVGQVNAIHDMLNAHVTQQREILASLKRLENGQALSADDGREQQSAPAAVNSGRDEQPQ